MFAKPLDEQKEEALLWSMMFLVIGVAAGIAMATMSYAFGVSGERLTLRLRDMVFRAYLKQVRFNLFRKILSKRFPRKYWLCWVFVWL